MKALVAAALMGLVAGGIVLALLEEPRGAPAPVFGPDPGGSISSDLPSLHEVHFEREIRRGWRTDFAEHVVPMTDFLRGGPPRDGIPPLDRPRTALLREGDGFLRASEPVIAVEVAGRARAYPYRLLIWHEIANDVLGGRPIAVTYCPLCNSALVWDRRVRGRVLRFGTTGNLRNSDLVMWDRRTQSWWQQFTGRGLVGAYAGTRLRPVEAQTLSWADFKRRYPAGDVLSQDTGFDRPYGINPYRRYDARQGRPFRFNGRSDDRLPAMERVAAVTVGGDTAVVPFGSLARRPVVQAVVGGTPAVVLYRRGVASPLDTGSIADGRDVGTAAAFDRRLGGRTLDFAARADGSFVDAQTGSTWDITGRAVTGPLLGRELTALRHDDQFWFALAAFHPRARIL